MIDITELLIQHVHIITAIPTSFINQLRRFNDIKMADNSKVISYGILRVDLMILTLHVQPPTMGQGLFVATKVEMSPTSILSYEMT